MKIVMPTKGESFIFIIVLLTLTSAIYGYYHPIEKNVPGDTQYKEVPVPVPYKVISKITVTVPGVTVYAKPEIKEVWPDWFTGDPNQQLTAIGLVQPYRGQTECASVINIATGDSRIVTKQLPLSLFGFDNDKWFGFGAAYVFDKDGLRNQFDAHAGWSFVRVGNWYVKAYGEVNTRPEGIAKLNTDLHF